ncbi:NAD(P)-binding protein [Armillaria solidipes]|uniref:NAD(P)-binding protein n=1 Tax=Armillaria solidipes TaxID=1076256 RepID=A0A2H3BPI1_9AGAR|nr:NAD(P)-binding protein [Armillaria solidipes]
MALECELAAPSIDDQLPPKTGRRYIVVGGAGFLGGWIVLQLLRRGEDPKCIRILHIRSSKCLDLLEGKAKDVKFLQVDISDKMTVDAAFSEPWPDNDESPISVFNTAVNVQGAENIIDACRKVGASVLVHTSSGSVPVHSSCFMLWPWQEEPKHFVQVINDDDELISKAHKDSSRITDTRNDKQKYSCVEPTTRMAFEQGHISSGKVTLHGYRTSSHRSHTSKTAPLRISSEEHLIESSKLGGQAFCIADPGLPPTYDDVYTELVVLDGEGSFPHLSPTFILLLAYLFEFLYLTRHLLNAYRYRFLAI